MKPIAIKNTYGAIVGFAILMLVLIDYFDKGQKFFDVLFPNNEVLNWRFFVFSVIFSGLIVWFVLNHLWQKEFIDHQKTKFEKENLADEMKILENERLVDIVTGVPNILSLEKDISKHLLEKRKVKQLQFIFIDLRNFREINKKYGFMKTNKILRFVAQDIYQSMRRNEDMYKYPIHRKKGYDPSDELESFYRIHTGGDEFAFIIEGDQSDAIGFANRLVNKFDSISEKAESILGKPEKLSFYAAIVEMSPRDEFEDIILRAKDCYRLAKESARDFAISWYPDDLEKQYPDGTRQHQNYKTARNLFDVRLVE